MLVFYVENPGLYSRAYQETSLLIFLCEISGK